MISISRADIKADSRVFVRCDLDVSIHNGIIAEPYRLDASLRTLMHIINRNAVPIIAGHMGRPHGRIEMSLSTKYLTPYFASRLRGRYEILENLRFDIREEMADPSYAEELARKADIYVNESFATCHRESASITGIPKLKPSFAGFQLQREVETLNNVLNNPKRPFTVIIGGAKYETKAPAIKRFSEEADNVLVGGKLAFNMTEVPSSVKIPIDYVDGDKDIGLKTLEMWRDIILGSKTIVWAGPLGMYEDKRYELGTRTVAELISQVSMVGCYSVVGGGDTIGAVSRFGLMDKFGFISTGGGAMLEYLTLGTLPGLKVLH